MAAAAQQWWVIAITQYGAAPQYVFFEGTKAAADAKAKLYVEVSAQPAVSGPYPSEAAAQAAVKAGKVNTPTVPTGPGVPNPLSGLAAIGDFFGRLTEANTWIRIAKVIIGGALVLIGLAHMTGATDAVSTAARKVPLPV